MRLPPIVITAHYWVVAGSTTQVYSSAVAAYVPVEDATYAAWLIEGHRPTRIASEAELWDVLIAHAPKVVPALVLQRVRDVAQTLITADTAASRQDVRILAMAVRALALLVLDNVNEKSTWVNGLKTAVAAANTLAQLKTGVAALPTLTTPTAAQLKAGIQAKIAGGQAD